MILDFPEDSLDAWKILAQRRLLPTDQSHAALQALPQAVARQSVFSARTLNQGLLGKYQDFVGNLLNPGTELRPDRATANNPTGATTVGMNPGLVQSRIKAFLRDEMHYQAAPGEEGTIKDLASDQRIKLVTRTQAQTAQGASRFVQQNLNADVVDEYPALEFLWEDDDSETPRGKRRTKNGLEDDPANGWPARWIAAAQYAGDDKALKVFRETKRMVALKSSPIWQALGDGAGGHESDALGNPYPPMALNSTIEVEDVDRDEAEELGLLGAGEKADAASFDWSSLFGEAS